MHEEVLELPGVAEVKAQVYEYRGQFEKVWKTYPEMNNECARALLSAGEYVRILSEYSDVAAEASLAALYLGKDKQAEALGATIPAYQFYTLPAEAFLEENVGEQEVSKMRYFLHLCSVVAGDYDDKSFQKVNDSQIMKLLENGDFEAAVNQFNVLEMSRNNYIKMNRNGNVFREILFPFTETVLINQNGAAELEKAWRQQLRDRFKNQQITWHISNYVLGNIDQKKFFEQPARIHNELFTHLSLALKYELNKSPEKALAEYRAIIGMPRFKLCYNPFTERFARWRVESLTQ